MVARMFWFKTASNRGIVSIIIVVGFENLNTFGGRFLLMEWREFAEWALQAALAGGVCYAAAMLSQMRKSVEQLNSQMGVILERDVWHQRWLEKHDEEISRLNRRMD